MIFAVMMMIEVALELLMLLGDCWALEGGFRWRMC